jgi:uncharacterized protein YkwD
VGILSTVRGGSYQAWDGTSMASPNAAGVAALALARCPSCTVAELRQRLLSSADPIGYAGQVGSGRANAARAVGNAAPTPIPPPEPTLTPGAPSPIYAGRVEQLINERRSQNSLQPLESDSRLRDASDFHNRWMINNNCFSHQCPGEPDPFQRMRNAGYPLAGGSEIIAAGYSTPSDVVEGWMNSTGHRNAILSGFVEVGCSYMQGPSTQYYHYWTCAIASPNEAQPRPTATRIPPTVQPTATRVPATATLRPPSPTVFPPTITRTATATFALPTPRPTETPFVRPTQRTPLPLPTRTPTIAPTPKLPTSTVAPPTATSVPPTATPQPGAARTAYVHVRADSRALDLQAQLCAWNGEAACDWSQATQETRVSLPSTASEMARERFGRLCNSGYLGVRC